MDRSIYSERRNRLRELLRDIRTEAGLRQVDLAQRLDQPQSFVSKYEAGERRLDIVELEQVCIACGVSLASFVSRFEP
ncbi:MAG: helix-turn-helix transcriptional regulator [Gammaproteobacteria bacterium]|nr:helix-turn-helix transcriptional regulator [Gammaproteobacteria bacterium]